MCRRSTRLQFVRKFRGFDVLSPQQVKIGLEVKYLRQKGDKTHFKTLLVTYES